MNFRRQSVLWAVLFLFLPFYFSAQEKRYSNGLYMERFSLHEGLYNQSSYSVVQGASGLLWLSSSYGLQSYDGYAFRLFPYPADMPFQSGIIEHLCRGPGNEIWFSVEQQEGIFYFDTRTREYQQPVIRASGEARKITGRVSALLASPEGEVWVGTTHSGLYRLQPIPDSAGTYHLTQLATRPDAPAMGPLSDDIRSLLLQENGSLWIASSRGLSELPPGEALTFRHYHIEAGQPQYSTHLRAATALAAARKGGIWVGGVTPKGLPALAYLSPSSRQLMPLRCTIPGRPPITQLLEARNGWLYIGSQTNGLHLLREPYRALEDSNTAISNHQFEPPAAWLDDFVIDLAEDEFDNIWIATPLNGLYKINPYFNQFSHYRPNPLPPDNTFYGTDAIMDTEGNIWMAGNLAGLYRYDRSQGTFTHFQHEADNPKSLSSSHIISLCLDKQNNLWAGTPAGPNRYDPESGTFIRYPEPKSFIMHMYEDAYGYRWFGSVGGGLTLLDSTGQVAARYDQSKGLSHNTVWQIFEDSRGEVYLATPKGLNRVIQPSPFRPDSLQFEHLLFPSPYIAWMHESQDGRYWLSHMGFGFYAWDPQTGSIRNHELYMDMGNQAYEDASGSLWFLGSRGITQFVPETEAVRVYGLDYGVPFAPMGRFGTPAPSGEIVSGAGEFGFTIFHPDSIRNNPTPPRVLISDVRPLAGPDKDSSLLAGGASAGEELRLPYRNNSIAIEYLALHFSRPEKNRYAYRLEGQDDGWIDAGESRIARYSKLRPGKYTFVIKAASAEGVWSLAEARLPIYIAPPWWLSWWAYVAYGLLIVAALLFANHLQQRQWRLQTQLQLEQQKALSLQEADTFKNHFITNITHEFRTPLTIILGMAGQARTQPQALLDRGLDMITRNGKILLRLVNQMLDLARVEAGQLKLHEEQGDIIPFLKYLLESFHSSAEQKDIHLSFQSSLSSLITNYDPERLSHVISNLIANAIKFTPEGGEVRVEVGSGKWESGKRKWEGGSGKAEISPPSPVPIAIGMADERRRKAESDEVEAIEIVVRDNGIGIAEEHLPHIFGRFYQGSEQRGGSGIGLALAKELVELMRGRIEVESEVGEGTSFTVKLPIFREAEALRRPVWAEAQRHRQTMAPEEQAFGTKEDHVITSTTSMRATTSELSDQPQPTGPMVIGLTKEGITPSTNTLLIVEDNRDVRQYLCDLLEGQFRVLTAADGKKGVETAIEEVPDVIISDIMMPELDGLGLLERLKNETRTSHIPIIMLTAKADLDSRIQGLRKGADAYLVKPFDRRELQAQLNNVLDTRRRLQEKYGNWQPEIIDEADQEAPFLKRAHEIILERLDDPSFSVESLCQALGVSRTQGYRKIQALTGQAPGELIRRHRIERAKVLLAESSLNIAQIAFDTGFKDPAYFARAFQRETGCSPTDYRNNTCHSPL